MKILEFVWKHLSRAYVNANQWSQIRKFSFPGLSSLGIKNVENLKDEDFPGVKVLPSFKRFNQKDDAFCRSWWDERLKNQQAEHFYQSYRQPLKSQWHRRGSGFGQRDFALRNASWHFPDIFAELKEGEDRREGFLDTLTVLRDGPEEKLEVESPEEAAKHIKHVAKIFGANLVGITKYDERWTYSKKYSVAKQLDKENKIPDEVENVIVIAQAMDKDLVQTVPSALSGAATGLGYGHDVLVLLSICQYIKNLGYIAIASMNDTALAIPYAIQAGLGEYGRHGLLITREYGPRVRLGKIFTDMPLKHDKPIRFGVKEFCDICHLCASGCPAKAIPFAPPTEEIQNQSTIVGIKKWSINAEKCFKYWTSINTDCSVCIRVCPYNRGNKWYDKIWMYLAGTRLRVLMKKIDNMTRRGKRLRPNEWWGDAKPNNTRSSSKRTKKRKA